MRLSEAYKYSALKTKEEEQLIFLSSKNWKGKHKIVDPSCWIGIEVEVENVPQTMQLQFWNAVADGSLRNNGMEFVTPPIRGKLIEAALTELNAYLHKDNPNHEFTDRTSVHVHLNVRHLEQEQLAMFLVTYLALEPLFFKYTEKIPNINREENNYCVPVNASKYHLNIPYCLGKYLATGESIHLTTLLQHWRKYTAFNLRPVVESRNGHRPIGTVEFRHMGGNCNVEYILGWVNMILSLRKYVKTHSTDEIKAELFSLNCNSAYHQFLEECVGTTLDLPFDDLMNLLEDSVSASKEIFSLIEEAKDRKPQGEEFLNSPLAKMINSKVPDGVMKPKQLPSEYIELLKLKESLALEYEQERKGACRETVLNTLHDQYLSVGLRISQFESMLKGTEFIKRNSLRQDPFEVYGV